MKKKKRVITVVYKDNTVDKIRRGNERIERAK